MAVVGIVFKQDPPLSASISRAAAQSSGGLGSSAQAVGRLAAHRCQSQPQSHQGSAQVFFHCFALLCPQNRVRSLHLYAAVGAISFAGLGKKKKRQPDSCLFQVGQEILGLQMMSMTLVSKRLLEWPGIRLMT